MPSACRLGLSCWQRIYALLTCLIFWCISVPYLENEREPLRVLLLGGMPMCPLWRGTVARPGHQDRLNIRTSVMHDQDGLSCLLRGQVP